MSAFDRKCYEKVKLCSNSKMTLTRCQFNSPPLLAVFEVKHKDAHAVCYLIPTLDIAVRVEFMARQVPSQAGNVTHFLFVTLLSGCHLSIAYLY